MVLFSELGFIFVLIKFPLTQISIKCGSHHRQILATPSPPLLWKCFCQPLTLGGCTPPSTPFPPLICSLRGVLESRLVQGENFISIETHVEFLKEQKASILGRAGDSGPELEETSSLPSLRVTLGGLQRRHLTCFTFSTCTMEVMKMTTPYHAHIGGYIRQH